MADKLALFLPGNIQPESFLSIFFPCNCTLARSGLKNRDGLGSHQGGPAGRMDASGRDGLRVRCSLLKTPAFFSSAAFLPQATPVSAIRLKKKKKIIKKCRVICFEQPLDVEASDYFR